MGSSFKDAVPACASECPKRSTSIKATFSLVEISREQAGLEFLQNMMNISCFRVRIYLLKVNFYFYPPCCFFVGRFYKAKQKTTAEKKEIKKQKLERTNGYMFVKFKSLHRISQQFSFCLLAPKQRRLKRKTKCFQHQLTSKNSAKWKIHVRFTSERANWEISS